MPSETLYPGDDWTVPEGVYVATVTLHGQAGEEQTTFQSSVGYGGRVEGDLSVSEGDTLYIRSSEGGDGYGGAAGGDSIDVRMGGTTLNDRVAVAAGGGGVGGSDDEYDDNPGGDGGPDTGEDGDDAVFSDGGTGGTQTSGGTGGAGANYGTDGRDGSLGTGGRGDGGGGAGYYGGGGGGSAQGDPGGGGGGGSNYVGGLSNIPYNGNERGGSDVTDYADPPKATIDWEPESVQYLSVNIDSDTSLSLNWSSPNNVSPDTYYIDRSTYDGGYSQIASTGGTNYTDTGLPQGAKYYYRVRADGVQSSDTESATTTLPAPSIDEVTLE